MRPGGALAPPPLPPLPEFRIPERVTVPDAPDFDALAARLVPPPGREPHAPILIFSDDDFTALNGVRSGSGTPEDPFVISDWVIPSLNDRFGGLHIEGTTRHVVVRDVDVVPLHAHADSCHRPGPNDPVPTTPDDIVEVVEMAAPCADVIAGNLIEDTWQLQVLLDDGVATVTAVGVRDAANVAFERVAAPEAWIVGCSDCRIESSRILVTAAEEIRRFRFAGNEFSHFGAYSSEPPLSSGENLVIEDNHRFAFNTYGSSVYAENLCPMRVERNVIDDIWSQMILACDDAAGTESVIARANEWREPTGCTGGYLAGGDLQVYAAARVVLSGNRHVAGCEAVAYAGDVEVCDNTFERGAVSVGDSRDVRVCRNTLGDGGILVDAANPGVEPEAGTTAVLEDNVVDRETGSVLWYFGTRGVGDALITGNTVNGVYGLSDESNSRWVGNDLSGSVLVAGCGLFSLTPCRSGTITVEDNDVALGSGLVLTTCHSATVRDNRISENVASVAVLGCGLADVRGNAITDPWGGVIVDSDGYRIENNTITGGEMGLAITLRRGLAVAHHNTITGVERPILLDGLALASRGRPLWDALEVATFTGTTVDGRGVTRLVACDQPMVDAAAATSAVLALVQCDDVTVPASSGLKGLLVANSTDVRVSGTMDDAAVAVQDYGSARTTLDHLAVRGASTGLFSLHGEAPRVLGSTFEDVGYGAIIGLARDVLVEGNSFRGGNGVFVGDADGERYIANTFRDTDWYAIESFWGTTVLAESNDARHGRVNGIRSIFPTGGTVVRGNTVIDHRYGVTIGGDSTVERNLVLGDAGGPAPREFQELHEVIADHFWTGKRPAQAGLWLAYGESEIRDNVIASHRVGAYYAGDSIDTFVATVANNLVENNGIGIATGQPETDRWIADRIERNTFRGNAVGYYSDCSSSETDTCGPVVLGNRFEGHSTVGLVVVAPQTEESPAGNDFVGNAVAYRHWTFSVTGVADLPPVCTGADNWWGDATGPQASWNPDGRGDPILCQQGAFNMRIPVDAGLAGAWLVRPADGGVRGPAPPALAASTTTPAAGEPVAFAAATLAPAELLWSFGDGASTAWASDATVAHAYRHGGRSHAVSVYARAVDGRLSGATVGIEIANAPPGLALAWSAADASVGKPVAIRAAYADEDGLAEFAWDLGDGTTASAALGGLSRAPFTGSLYLHGVASGFGAPTTGLEDMETMDATPPASPAPKAWHYAAGQYVWYDDGGPSAGYDSLPRWTFTGPLFADGDATLTFWASRPGDPALLRGFRVSLIADGVEAYAREFPDAGAALGVAPSKVTLPLDDVRILAHESVTLQIAPSNGLDFSDVYSIWYDGTLQPSAIDFGAAADAGASAAAGVRVDPELTGALAASAAPTARVFVDAEDLGATATALAALGASDLRPSPLVGTIAAEIPRAALSAILALPGVTAVWHDGPLTFFGEPGAAPVAPAIVRPDGLTGEGVTVAVLDSGFDTRHPELRGKFARVVDLTVGGETSEDGGVHGTAMAGIVAGETTGVAPGATLVGVKFGFQDDTTSEREALWAMEWVVAHRDELDIRVASMSFGKYCFSAPCDGTSPMSRMVNALVDHGVLAVVAAGNRGDGASTVASPGDAAFALTVGALDTNGTETLADDEVAWFSSRGPNGPTLKPDLAAPGVRVPAPGYGRGVDGVSGTSPATAHVAGLAALLIEARPTLTPLELKNVLAATAFDLGEPGPDYATGAGAADVAAAVDGIPTTLTLGPDHAFEAEGFYRVAVSARDPHGALAAAEVEIPIAKATFDPVARFTPAQTAAKVGQALAFVDRSADANGGVVAIAWDFGDGSTATGAEVAHAWAEAGTFTVTLTVTNALGRTDTDARTVTVSASGAVATWWFHGEPSASLARTERMDAAAPADHVPNPWTVARTHIENYAPTSPATAGRAEWVLSDGPVRVLGNATVTLWAQTKNAHGLWPDAYMLALRADGALVAWQQLRGNLVTPAPGELRLALTGLDVYAEESLTIVVIPTRVNSANLASYNSLLDPVTFLYDSEEFPSRLEVELGPLA